MSVRVCVRKQSPLQHFIRAWFDTGNKMCRTKGQLLNFGKIIFGIFVQHHLTNRNQGEITMRPDFG